MAAPDVQAAGAVVTRKGGDVLLVHRPRYDDWSFPKGKLDRGEHVTTAAVREVAEETGLDIRLGPQLTAQRYPVRGNRMKTVHYWVGRVIGDDDVSGYTVNHEIDEVAWFPWEKARRQLTYSYDRATLDEAERLRKKTRALVVLRHGHSRSRGAWRGDDRKRPLVKLGTVQAQKLVPILAAFDVTSMHTSSSVRCVDTVAPYAHTTGWPMKTYDALAEEAATVDAVVDLVDELVELKEGAVICTHRPVIPTVLDALGVPDTRLEPGELLVVHHRKRKVIATERHKP